MNPTKINLDGRNLRIGIVQSRFNEPVVTGLLNACEAELKNYLRAREYCEKAITSDKNDATSYYMLGTVFMDLFNRDNRRDYLVKAQDNIQQALSINPAAEFAVDAKRNLTQIREFLPIAR